MTEVNPLQYAPGCWESELTALLGYSVCSFTLGPLLYEISPFCSIYHNNISLGMTPLFLPQVELRQWSFLVFVL